MPGFFYIGVGSELRSSFLHSKLLPSEPSHQSCCWFALLFSSEEWKPGSRAGKVILLLLSSLFSARKYPSYLSFPINLASRYCLLYFEKEWKQTLKIEEAEECTRSLALKIGSQVVWCQHHPSGYTGGFCSLGGLGMCSLGWAKEAKWPVTEHQWSQLNFTNLGSHIPSLA